MKTGFSGATIARQGIGKVIKRGAGLRTQAEYCRLLYPLTPKVISWDDDWYTMEELYELPTIGLATSRKTDDYFREMKTLLKVHAWRHKVGSELNYFWKTEVIEFARFYDYEIQDTVETLFNDDHMDYTYIHGDPTLSNLMVEETRAGHLVICDPLRPLGKIPYHSSVDMGKLLQSAIGWEKIVFGWKYDSSTCIDAVLSGETPLNILRAWFWCFIHLLRILPYAKAKPKEYDWAAKASVAVFKSLDKLIERIKNVRV